jgi:hypothetical protein
VRIPDSSRTSREARKVPQTDIHVMLGYAHASKTKRVPVYERKSFVGIAPRAVS